MDLKNYKFEPGAHRNKPVIWVRFPYHFHLKNALKKDFHQLNGANPINLGFY